MARMVNEQEYAARRSQILDAAQALIYTKGYDQMTIQDILNALQISKGAFYHYFDSKQALLEALIVRMVEQMMTVLRPIIEDEQLPALRKLETVWCTAAGWKSERIAFLTALIKVWYDDHNALMRDKLYRATLERFSAVLQAIIEQGIAEGTMVAAYPDLAGVMAMDLLHSMSNEMMRYLMIWDQLPDGPRRIERLLSAYTDAVERLLGVAQGALRLVDPAIFDAWGEVLSQKR